MNKLDLITIFSITMLLGIAVWIFSCIGCVVYKEICFFKAPVFTVEATQVNSYVVPVYIYNTQYITVWDIQGYGNAAINDRYIFNYAPKHTMLRIKETCSEIRIVGLANRDIGNKDDKGIII